MTFLLRQGKLGPENYFHDVADFQEVSEGEAMYSALQPEFEERSTEAWMLDESGLNRIVYVITQQQLQDAVESDRASGDEDGVAIKFCEDATHAAITYHPEEDNNE